MSWDAETRCGAPVAIGSYKAAGLCGKPVTHVATSKGGQVVNICNGHRGWYTRGGWSVTKKD